MNRKESMDYQIQFLIREMEKVKQKIWQLENPPTYKYGHVFGSKNKVIKVTYISDDLEHPYTYTVDTGKGLIELNEDDINKLITS